MNEIEVSNNEDIEKILIHIKLFLLLAYKKGLVYMPYEIGLEGGHIFIKCKKCNFTSYSIGDVEDKFCNKCQIWHKH